MSTLLEIFKFEEQLEEGFRRILSGTTDNIYYRRSVEKKASPCIDVLATTGQARRHERNQTSASDEDMFNASLSLTVITSRAKAAQLNQHHELLSRVRVALLSSSGNYIEDNFSNLAILEIVFAGSDYEVDDDTGHDMTTLNYSLVFAIRPSAWPSAEAGVFSDDFSIDFV